MYMTKEVLMEKAVNKLKELAGKDFSAMSSKEKAFHVIELDRLYNSLSPFRSGSEVAGAIADDCLMMKRQLIESDFRMIENTRERTARVIMQGLKETPYNVPWLNQ